jgi:hypothetical protein
MRITFFPIRLLTACAAIAFSAGTVHAQNATRTWNPGNDPGGASAGNGTWNLTDANWWNGSSNVAWTTANSSVSSDKAVFAGTDGTPGQYVVTLSSNVSVASNTSAAGTQFGLDFQSSGYVLRAAAPQTIIFAVPGTPGGIRVASGKSAEIGTNVTVQRNTSSDITIYGGGTLNVSGRIFQNSANNFTLTEGSTLNVLSGGIGTFQSSVVVGNSAAGGNIIVSGGNVTQSGNSSNLVLA